MVLLLFGLFGCSRGHWYPREKAATQSEPPCFDDSPFCLRHDVRTRTRQNFVVSMASLRHWYQWNCPSGHLVSDEAIVDPALRHLTQEGIESVRWRGHRQETGWYAGHDAEHTLRGRWELVRPTIIVLAVNPSVLAVVDAPIEETNGYYIGESDPWRQRAVIHLGHGFVYGTRIPLSDGRTGWLRSVRLTVVGTPGSPTIDASSPGEIAHGGVVIRWTHVPESHGPERWLDFSISLAPKP